MLERRKSTLFPHSPNESHQPRLTHGHGSDLSAVGVPLQFSAETTWRTASDVGAFLVTAPKIIHEDFNDGYNRPYRKWMRENFNILFAHGQDELQRYGLWVILETYSTEACVIQTWAGKTKEVKLALVANAMMAGELGPSIEWSRNSNCEAVSAYASDDYGGRVVVRLHQLCQLFRKLECVLKMCQVFCNGIRFKFARRWQGLKRVVGSLAMSFHSKSLIFDVASTRRGTYTQAQNAFVRAGACHNQGQEW